MINTICKIKEYFLQRNFANVQGNENEIVDELYAFDESIMEKLTDKKSGTQLCMSERTVHYKNEYHDEDVKLIQLTWVDDLGGIGKIKKITEDLCKECFDCENLQLRPAYVYQVVPAIELGINENRFVAGGLVRPELLNKYGIDFEKNTVFSMIFVEKNCETLTK